MCLLLPEYVFGVSVCGGGLEDSCENRCYNRLNNVVLQSGGVKVGFSRMLAAVAWRTAPGRRLGPRSFRRARSPAALRRERSSWRLGGGEKAARAAGRGGRMRGPRTPRRGREPLFRREKASLGRPHKGPLFPWTAGAARSPRLTGRRPGPLRPPALCAQWECESEI